MTLHLNAQKAKDGIGATITGGAQFNDESGAGTGPFDQAVVLIDSTQAEILGTTADAAVATDANGSVNAHVRGLVKIFAAALAAAGALFSKITDGTNTAAVKAASTAPAATDPALVVAISPNSVNANGRKTPANSAPVVQASQAYNTIAASASAQALTGGSGGAAGDWLDFILIVPATTAAGAVSITDGTGSAITIWAGGGTTALVSLVPFAVPIRAISASGAWKVTTGANVSAIASGNFT